MLIIIISHFTEFSQTNVFILVVIVTTFHSLCPPSFFRCIQIQISFREFRTDLFQGIHDCETFLLPLSMSPDILSCSFNTAPQGRHVYTELNLYKPVYRLEPQLKTHQINLPAFRIKFIKSFSQKTLFFFRKTAFWSPVAVIVIYIIHGGFLPHLLFEVMWKS